MGSFSSIFIDRPILAMVISIVVVLLGGISIPLLPVASMPDITPPTVKVTTSYPGASSVVVEETVTSPIEQQVNGVENMLYMTSKSTSSGALDLTVTFAIGTDPDMATVLTQNRVNIALPLLPEDVKRQGIKVEKQSTQLVMMVALNSPDGRYDDIYLSNYSTTQIKDALARQPGVGQVTIFGAKDFGMRIWMDPAKLKSRGLTTADLLAALREQNVQVAAGQIGAPPSPEGLNFQYNVTTLGRLADVSQFEGIIVKAGTRGELVRVRDVARVELGSQAYTWYASLDAGPASLLGIYQLPGANAVQVSEAVVRVLEEAAPRFPEGLEWSIPFDSTRYINQSIREVISSLILAVILVVLVVYVFLQDFRTTLIPALAIPVSLIGTFSVMLVSGLSINNLSLFGLILAIGIVVDDAIVVVENTTRLIDEEGLAPKDAARKAMHEVGGAVVATTLVLLAVFAPTIVMPGLTGRLYQQFAITISVATVFSSVNALTLAPALAGMLLRPSAGRKKNRFFVWFEETFERTTNRYTDLVNMALHRSAMMAVAFVAMLASMIFLFGAVPGGFIPGEDEGYFFVNTELPPGASLERTKKVMAEVDEILMGVEAVQNVVTVGGYSLLNAVQGSNSGMNIVTLKHWDERPGDENSIWGVMQQVQKQFSQIREGIIFAFPPPPISGLGSAGGFEMQLQDIGGVGLQKLETFANDMVATGNADPMLTRLNQNYRASEPQLFVDVDRDKVKSLNIPLQSVFDALQANLGSAYVNDFNLYGRTWKVMVQADEEYRDRAGKILKLEVRDEQGNMIPIGTVASVSDAVGPQSVNRFNLFRAATLTGGPALGFTEGQSVDRIEQIAETVLPRQMTSTWSGVTYQQKAAGNVAPLLFSLAIIFGFLFLAAQYESWANPLSVMLSVPLAILGALLFTILRSVVTPGMENNVYMQVGLVLLIGLSAKTAILIVEFAKQQHEQEGKDVFEAAAFAARLRFRAILMTAFSFILGVIPLVIASGAGAKSRVALGTAVAGGMLLYTILGVFFIPVLYAVIERGYARLRGGGADAALPTGPEPRRLG